MADYIWGRYPVLEALRSRRRVQRILVAQGPRDPAIGQVLDQARRVGVMVETTSRRRLDDLTNHANHQGIMAVTSPREYADVEDILRAWAGARRGRAHPGTGCHSGCGEPRLAYPYSRGDRGARRHHSGTSRRRPDSGGRQDFGRRCGVSPGRTSHQHHQNTRRSEETRGVVHRSLRRFVRDLRPGKSHRSNRIGGGQ